MQVLYRLSQGIQEIGLGDVCGDRATTGAGEAEKRGLSVTNAGTEKSFGRERRRETVLLDFVTALTVSVTDGGGMVKRGLSHGSPLPGRHVGRRGRLVVGLITDEVEP